MSRRKKKQNQQNIANVEKMQQREYLKIENFGKYFAKVVSIEENRIVLKNVVIDGIRHYGIGFIGSEDHVNIVETKDVKTLTDKDVHPGYKICFTAQPYGYTRKDGSVDISLCDISDVEFVDNYHIPTKDELIDEQIQNLVCEVCIFNENCCGGMCIANQEERKKKIEILKNLQPGKFTPLTVLAAYEIWGKLMTQIGGFDVSTNDPNYEVIKKIEKLSSEHNEYIWPFRDAFAHMSYPEFPRIYFE